MFKVRLADASDFYAYSSVTDNLRLVAQGGLLGTFGEVGDEQIFPVPLLFDGMLNRFDMTVDGTPTSLNVRSFAAQGLQPNRSSRVLLGAWTCLLALGLAGFWWGSADRKR